MLLDKTNSFFECKDLLDNNISSLLDSSCKVLNFNSSETGHFLYLNIIYKGYKIKFESFHDLFDIDIYDSEMAFTNLCFQYKFNNKMNIVNIKNAFKLLKEMIITNDFPLYIIKDDKKYIKYKGTIKRIKQIQKAYDDN